MSCAELEALKLPFWLALTEPRVAAVQFGLVWGQNLNSDLRSSS